VPLVPRRRRSATGTGSDRAGTRAGGPAGRRSAGDEVVLTDPGSVKVLGHPARLAVIDELYAGQALTATELAGRVGVSPSAMSYHLRQLERYGIVRRSDSRGDGRERPWERAGRRLRVEVDETATGSGAARATQAAASLLVQEALRRDVQRMVADREDDEQSSFYSRVRIDVSPAEFAALEGRVLALLDEYRDRTTETQPAGTRPMYVTLLAVPVHPTAEVADQTVAD
jgi:DNA-binding transcriptional ArsR family regulator